MEALGDLTGSLAPEVPIDVAHHHQRRTGIEDDSRHLRDVVLGAIACMPGDHCQPPALSTRSQPSGKGPADWFTGTVRIDPLFQAPDPALVAGASVTFARSR